MQREAGQSGRPVARGQVRARAAARGAERRRRLWWSVASWATTGAIVVAVGLLVHWRVTSVLREADRVREAEAALRNALRDARAAPPNLERAAARLRAVIADYPDTEAARKAEEELAKIAVGREKGRSRHPDGDTREP